MRATKAIRVMFALALLPAPFKGGHAQAQAPASTAQSNYAGFAQPLYAQALFEGDAAYLLENRERVAYYFSGLVPTLHGSDTFFRMGAEAELILDPRVLQTFNWKRPLDIGLHKDSVTIALDCGKAMGSGYLQERKKNVDSGIFGIESIFRELGGGLNGLRQGCVGTDVTMLAGDGVKDAKYLMHVASADQESFARFYATVSDFVRLY